MAMAEPREWQQHKNDDPPVDERLRVAEEQRVQAEGRCFAAERRRLDAERRLAEAEQLLEQVRAVGERTGQLVGELIALAAQMRRSLERTPPQAAAVAGDAVAAERVQMADALAAAIERLRARWPIDGPVDHRSVEVKSVEADEAVVPDEAGVPDQADAAERPQEQAVQPVVELPMRAAPHKHSMSAIARWRNRRKQRQAP